MGLSSLFPRIGSGTVFDYGITRDLELVLRFQTEISVQVKKRFDGSVEMRQAKSYTASSKNLSSLIWRFSRSKVFVMAHVVHGLE